MVEVGDRVLVESEKVGAVTRSGVVTDVDGRLITVRWTPDRRRCLYQAPVACRSHAMSRKPTRLAAPERLPLGPGWTHRAERQIRSLVLRVDLIGSRRIWAAHVGCLVGPDGSRRLQTDRLDDQRDDQGPSGRLVGVGTAAACGPGPSRSAGCAE